MMSREPEALESEISRLRQYIDAMHGKGNVRHVYSGACPDELNPDARDEKCPACRLLMARPA